MGSKKSGHVGFTLLELLVVVIIIGILATIALPQFTKTIERARQAECNAILGSISTAESAYFQEHAAYTTDKSKLLADLPGDASTLHYFKYSLDTAATTDKFTSVATRKTTAESVTGGKSPGYGSAYTVKMDSTAKITKSTDAP